MTIKSYIAFVATIAISVVGVNYSSKISDASSVETDNSKLSPNIIPLQYDVNISTNLPHSRFNGSVLMFIYIKTPPVIEIKLHSAFLTIEKIAVDDTYGRAENAKFYVDPPTEMLGIYFGSYLESQYYNIIIYFKGSYDESGVGFFRGNYTREGGNISYFAATNFEGSYARRAFPCFDEPHFRSAFKITLTTKMNYTSYSNTPITKDDEIVNNDTYVEVFEKSSDISICQVAFVTTDFKSIDHVDPTTELPKYRILGRFEAIASGDGNYAVDAIPSIYRAVTTYTNLSTKIERITMICIPHFRRKSSGNGVLIMYSESILFPEYLKHIALQAKQQVILDVTFGVVQLLFRTHLERSVWTSEWLVGGFATFLSYKVGHEVQPEWRLDDQFVDKMWYCLEVESEKPISLTGKTDNRTTNENNNIVHLKAGLVFRMLQHIVTDEVFRGGLFRYLYRDRDWIISPDVPNLYSEIQESVNARVRNSLPPNISVYEIMKTWETEAGYPVVSFIRDYAENTVTISQKCHSMNRTRVKGRGNWYIPITWTTEYDLSFVNTQPTKWLYPKSISTLPLKATKDQWIIANLQATGYYRVNYDDTNWKLITKYWNSRDYYLIKPLNRAQLIDDAFNLARSGHLNYTIVFDILNCLRREEDYIVHLAYFRVLKYIDKVASWSNSYGVFEKFVGTTFGWALNVLGYHEPEYDSKYNSHVHNMHRNEVIHWACLMKNSECRNITSYKLMSNHYAISDNLQFTIACAAVRGAKGRRNAEWGKLNNLSIVPVANKNRTVYNRALGCIEDADTLNFYLNREVNRNNTKVFENVYTKGSYGRKFVFNYILVNFTKLETKIGDGLGKVLVDFSEHLLTKDHIMVFQSFKNITRRPNVKKSIDIAIPIIKRNYDLTRVDAIVIEGAIRSYFNVTM